jgi:Trk K+ transport system NAD-binding subunit
MLVLLTGIIFLLILLPFTFIQFFYAPWLEAQIAARAPRRLFEAISGHVILTHHDPVTASLIRKLTQFNYKYVLVVPDLTHAARFVDQGLNVVVGELDDPDTYRSVHAERSALVVTTQSDIINTNVTFTVREVAPSVPIVATANSSSSLDILERAGATHVLELGDMMGRALVRCTVGGDAVTHVIGNIDELLIAEANAARTPLVGKTLRENRLNELGVNVIGMWERGKFQYATADTVVGPNSILVLAGSAAQFQNYDEQFMIYNVSVEPVVILGGGRVGRAASQALATRGIDWRIVEQVPNRVSDSKRVIPGNAADLDVLTQAGILTTPAVLITTHDDSLNIYLTIYCRRLRSDIQIISRSTLERNTAALHRAGADFVLSYSSMGAMTMFNLIKRSRIINIAEGLDVFRLQVPQSLANKSLIASGVREKTGCTIVALRGRNGLQINPKPDTVLLAGSEMFVVGNLESENKFLECFGEGSHSTP